MQTVVLLVATLLTTAQLEVKLEQVAPANAGVDFRRSDGCERAVVLIHGLKVHPFSSRKVDAAAFHGWQQAESELVHTLSSSCDVFALAYSQNVAVEEIAASQKVRQRLQTLQALGYDEISLIGHSAGGLIARQLAEDCPSLGITKVVQAGSPNTGSCWARGTIAVRSPQEVFLSSLTQAARTASLNGRQTCRIPDQVEFVCVVGDLGPYRLTGTVPAYGDYTVQFAVQANPYGDGMVSAESQWPFDLRQQGVPMVTVDADHCEMMHCPQGIEQIVKLVETKQPRWTMEQVEEAEKKLGRADRFCCEFPRLRKNAADGESGQ
jgi:pimeloyl-ACP methyl ester carboxylesterase